MNDLLIALVFSAASATTQARTCSEILFDLKMKADPAVTVPEYVAELDARLLRDDSDTKAKCVFRRDYPAEADAKEHAETAARQAELARAKAARQAEVARVMALPDARIGMTAKQVIDKTNWGRPSEINRTTTKHVVHEEWVYSPRRLLYFDNGVLTAIQE